MFCWLTWAVGPEPEHPWESKMISRLSRVVTCGSVIVALALGGASAALARDLVVALKTEPSSMDPQYHALTPNTQISQTIFDPIVRVDEQLKPQPALAESWTVDGKVWTFKLRPDVKFSDGTPFTAEDVVFTYDRIPRFPTVRRRSRCTWGRWPRPRRSIR